MASGGRGVSPAFGSGKSGKPHQFIDFILIVSSQQSALRLLCDRLKSLITTDQGFVRNLFILDPFGFGLHWTDFCETAFIWIDKSWYRMRIFVKKFFYTWYFFVVPGNKSLKISFYVKKISLPSLTQDLCIFLKPARNYASFVTVPFADNFKIKQFSTLIKGRCYFLEVKRSNMVETVCYFNKCFYKLVWGFQGRTKIIWSLKNSQNRMKSRNHNTDPPHTIWKVVIVRTCANNQNCSRRLPTIWPGFLER